MEPQERAVQRHGMASGERVRPELVCIVNGNASGSGSPGKTERAVVRALMAEGAGVNAVVTRSTAGLHDALRAAGARRTVLVGGDGTS